MRFSIFRFSVGYGWMFCFLIAGCGSDTNGPNRLVAAARNGELSNVQSIIASGVNINADEVGMLGDTPISAAAGLGHVEIVEYLLNVGADPNSRNRDGTVPLVSAVGLGDSNIKIVKLLVEHGADVNLKDHDGNSVLDYAKARRCPKVIELLESAASTLGESNIENLDGSATNGTANKVIILPGRTNL